MNRVFVLFQGNKTRSTMSLLKKLQKIDDQTKYAVYGWLRKAEEELNLNHIPLMISSICILYYHMEEIFQLIPYHIKLSDDNKCITKLSTFGWGNTCYGINQIQRIIKI